MPLLMYTDLADWFSLLTPPADYEDEATKLRAVFERHAERRVEAVLELGSGGGHNAHYLQQWYELTLVDVAPAMLEVSARLNPDVEHLLGDMRDVRLERDFDAVLIHDAVSYMTTEPDLAAAVATAAAHLRPGGVAVFAPDFTKESFEEKSTCGGSDDATRGLRLMDWTHDPDPEDTWYVCDFAYLLREGDGPPRCLSERHVLGLFPAATWLAVLERAGLTPVRDGEYFVGRKRTGR